MPLNYLDLQAKIRQYAQKAAKTQKAHRDKVQIALDLLDACAVDKDNGWIDKAAGSNKRTGLPAYEISNSAITPDKNPDKYKEAYILLAADGSQIIPSAHDAVPLSLINTSLIALRSDSQQAPNVEIRSVILENPDPGHEIALMNEDLINLERDISELEILAGFTNYEKLPVIALRDGPLELFHQPRQGRAFEESFKAYKNLLSDLCMKKYMVAGYIDRPRATTLTTMLSIYASMQSTQSVDFGGLPDILVMGGLLKPGQRSAVFALQSSASQYYQDDLRIHFFYLNVGREGKPYIVRVEIPDWVARATQNVSMLQRTLLDQCALMGSRPYPYLLHRAHEEAVVHFDEKEQLQNTISLEMQREGMGFSQPSNKQSAKELTNRTRM